MGITIEGLRPLIRRLNQLPKAAQQEVREAAQAIADDEATRITAAGRSSDKQSRAAAEFGGGSSKRFTRDVIETKITSARGRTRTKRTFGAVKFAGKKATTNQFRPHLGRTGYWMWPTLRRDEQRMVARWVKALEAIEREWSRGGGR